MSEEKKRTLAEAEAYITELEGVMRDLLPMGTFNYADFKDRPSGRAYLRAMVLVGSDEQRALAGNKQPEAVAA